MNGTHLVKPFYYYNGSFAAPYFAIHKYNLFGWSTLAGLINRHYVVDENGACVTFIIYEYKRYFLCGGFFMFRKHHSWTHGYK